MNYKKTTFPLMLIALVVFAAGCTNLVSVPPPATNPDSPVPPTVLTQSPIPPLTGTPQAYPMIPYPGPTTSSSGSASVGYPPPAGDNTTPTGMLTPMVPDSSGNLTVTLADRGRIVQLQVGQRFLLDLGDTYVWTISIADQNIVSRVPNIMTIQGSQGLFEAHTAGTTTLQASGDPACRQSKPPCAMPSILFEITITVQ